MPRGLFTNRLKSMHIREFIDTNFVSDSMLNNVVGSVVFFEVFDGDIKVIRVNFYVKGSKRCLYMPKYFI